jgi:hypothetical protein
LALLRIGEGYTYSYDTKGDMNVDVDDIDVVVDDGDNGSMART